MDKIARNTAGRVVLVLLLLGAGAGVSLATGRDYATPFDFETTTPGQELGCLALNIYHEARGESSRGQAAIAAVTMNRVRSRHYPDTVCGVVWQRKQFSWTRADSRYHAINDVAAWQYALTIARLFIDGAVVAEIGGATHFHAENVTPYWMDDEKLITKVGGHYFYIL